MVTTNSEWTFIISGLSTEHKPLLSAKSNGAAFIEIDTGNVYLYDAENKKWIKNNATGIDVNVDGGETNSGSNGSGTNKEPDVEVNLDGGEFEDTDEDYQVNLDGNNGLETDENGDLV